MALGSSTGKGPDGAAFGYVSRALIGVIAGFGVAGSTSAAPPALSAPEVQAIIQCKAETDPAKRLACFDQAVRALAAADANGDLLTLNRQQRKTVRRQSFGLALPAFTLFDRGEKPEEVNTATYKIVEAWTAPDGKWTFKLDTGAVWRQTDDNELMRTPKAGSTAEVTRGVLGSFFMKVDNQLSIRVHRDN